jgi:hypothetical protein
MALNRASASGLGGCLSECHFLTRFLYAARISDGEVSLGRLRILWYSSGGFPIGQRGAGEREAGGAQVSTNILSSTVQPIEANGAASHRDAFTNNQWLCTESVMR